jgi:hypothetical protein
MKHKTVLTESVVETHTITINQNNLNDKLKRSSTQLNENLVVLCRYKTTHSDRSTTKDYKNSIHILPKQNFDTPAETEFRCSSLEAWLLSTQEKYTTYTTAYSITVLLRF